MLIRVLSEHAQADPDRELVASPGGSRTYGQALARAEAMAKGLAERDISRFACLVADPAEVITLLCAASAIGAEPCVYPAALDDEGVRELADALDHRHVVTAREIDVGDREVIPPDALPVDGDELPPAPEHAPVLILTTGTTGRPKGARHEWSRLLAGVRPRATGASERWLLAYNLNQFGGIQVMLQALASGSTLVVGESNQPRDAIAAIRDLGITHASATPTFWRFMLGLLDDATVASLSLEQITLGGEAVPSALLDELRRLFPSARVSQVYASAEAGSAVSVRDGRNGLPVSVLERGDDAGVQFRIVDGELQARSKVGMLGYAGEDDEAEGWRRTGDLVEIEGDRIQFVGRVTEIVNVGGVKVHPLKVEEIVGAVDGVALAHVYGRANPMTGQIVAVDVVAQAGIDTDDLKERIRTACESLPPAAQPRRIKFVDALEVRENKVIRRPADVQQT